MLNFTVGPVQMDEEIKTIGAEDIPYFRTSDFSKIMLDNERIILKLFEAPEGAKAIFLTGSGTSGMESSVMNILTCKDKVLIVNGGSFGKRFVEICQIHDIPYTEIVLSPGQALTAEHLNQYENSEYTAFLVNVHETSTGVLYDMSLISNFCKRNGLVLIADCISSFLADPLNMTEYGIDVAITGSQKALAVPPGISIVVLSRRAIQRVKSNSIKSLYFNFNSYLLDMERGQTPFTPAVGILLQINKRLKQLEQIGVAAENNRIKNQAEDFRKKVKSLGFTFFAENMSNAVTALRVNGKISAHRIFEILKDEYSIFVCPNGGELKDTVFRVGHIGSLTFADNDTLIDSLRDLQIRGIL